MMMKSVKLAPENIDNLPKWRYREEESATVLSRVWPNFAVLATLALACSATRCLDVAALSHCRLVSGRPDACLEAATGWGLGRYSLIAEKSGLERLSREGSNLGDVATQVPVNADADVLHERHGGRDCHSARLRPAVAERDIHRTSLVSASEKGLHFSRS
jgi:hypothetical protein